MSSAAAGTTYPRGVKQPRQQRSNETYERILDRAETLLDGRDFETITIAEVMEQADVSASSIYARFGDKDDLLRALHVRHFERVRQLVEAVAGSDEWDALGLGEISERLIRLCIAHRRNNAPRIQSFRHAERRHPDFEARRHATDLWMLKTAGDYFEKRLAEHGREFDRKDLALSCYLIACSVEAAASAPAGLGAPLRDELDDEWLVASLTRMTAKFLRFDEVESVGKEA